MYAATSSNWGPQVQWRLLQLDALGAEHSEAHRRERRRTIVRRWGELGAVGGTRDLLLDSVST